MVKSRQKCSSGYQIYLLIGIIKAKPRENRVHPDRVSYHRRERKQRETRSKNSVLFSRTARSFFTSQLIREKIPSLLYSIVNKFGVSTFNLVFPDEKTKVPSTMRSCNHSCVRVIWVDGYNFFGICFHNCIRQPLVVASNLVTTPTSIQRIQT